MKPERAFVADRIAVQHCAQLLRRGAEPSDLLPDLQRLADRLARQLAPALAQFLGLAELDFALAPVAETSETDLAEAVGPLAANSVLAMATPGATLLSSIDGPALLRLVDRAFGGNGETSGPLPDRFPPSADLMAEKIEAILAQHLGEICEQPTARIVRRDSRIAELTPFPAGARLAILSITFGPASTSAWRLTLALPMTSLARFLGQKAGSGPEPGGQHVADPMQAPFADLPLPVLARLVDMRVPLAALASLEPGVVLPVAIARAVPLCIGETVIARGTIGSQDDCVAIKVSQIYR